MSRATADAALRHDTIRRSAVCGRPFKGVHAL
jgi:hypothetical protein